MSSSKFKKKFKSFVMLPCRKVVKVSGLGLVPFKFDCLGNRFNFFTDDGCINTMVDWE